MQNLNVSGVVVSVSENGELVAFKNEGKATKLVIAGNPREEVASDSFTLFPGQAVALPKGSMTECRIVVGQFMTLPVVTVDEIPLDSLGLIAELVSVGIADTFVMEGDQTLKLVPTDDN